MALFNDSQIRQHPIYQRERSSEEPYETKDLFVESRKNIRLYYTKKWVGYCKVTFLLGMAEVYKADYLISANRAVPDWFKIIFLGEPEF